MRRCFVNTDALFPGLLVPGWLLAALLSACFPAATPRITHQFPPSHTYMNEPPPPPLHRAAPAPEIAAHAAPGLQDVPPFLQSCSSPAPALLGSLGRQPAGWGGCAENLRRCFPFLGRKPNCSLPEFYKLCTQRFHLGRKEKKNILLFA